ncbi:MAG: tripartite tricarboxylate transporter permease [Betaproteobacteria bacterium]|nr:tripartite tricarboxylate transporter permease [Betaproteobacteria bacterium]
MDALVTAFGMVFSWQTLIAMLGASVFGLFVGAVPGLTATMAIALLVPVTFFMPPIPAIAAMVAATAMAIFSGDIPGCLLRMPGTPASAAYTDEAYAMTRKGQAETALGAGLVFSAIAGLFGTAVLIVAAPALADFALKFSSFEYFWLVLLGLTCAIVITSERPLKGTASLLLGLLIATVGLGNPAGFPRFTFGSTELMGGLGFIPLMIGMFAVSEIIRYTVNTAPAPEIVDQPIHNVFKGMWALTVKYPMQILRGSALGTLVGALPGAGADIAAWMSYAVSKKMSKEPEKYGTGHVEGIIESGAANNSALAGAFIPALVFGIPGDSITAIVIGVLYMKNMNPGPTLFTQNPQNLYAVYLLFILANLIMIPLGWWCIKVSKQILRVPRNILMPIILLFCIVGAFAINNTPFDVGVMLAAGVVAYLLEENGFPVAPAILGVVLGPMLEENFVTSMIKADGNLLAFFARPVAASLGVLTLLAWFAPPLVRKLAAVAPGAEAIGPPPAAAADCPACRGAV